MWLRMSRPGLVRPLSHGRGRALPCVPVNVSRLPLSPAVRPLVTVTCRPVWVTCRGTSPGTTPARAIRVRRGVGLPWAGRAMRPRLSRPRGQRGPAADAHVLASHGPTPGPPMAAPTRPAVAGPAGGFTCDGLARSRLPRPACAGRVGGGRAGALSASGVWGAAGYMRTVVAADGRSRLRRSADRSRPPVWSTWGPPRGP